MQVDKRYAFRERLITSNQPILREEGRTFGEEYLSLEKGVKFIGLGGEVIDNAKADFIDCLSTCFGAFGEEVEIEIILAPDALGDYKGYKGRKIVVKADGITVYANDERGAASALFDLEIILKREKAPFIKIDEYSSKPAFSPRMTHSAFDMDEFPDGYLLNLAKEGIDAIIIFVRGINRNMKNQECDVNDIIRRANSYGLDAYAYCVLKNFHHPDEENAEEIFDSIYGEFYKAHSGFKGMVFVGESVEFPSKDPHVGGLGYGCFYAVGEDRIPFDKPSPGFWPCSDYPKWLNLIKKCIRKHRSDAEIVFWTYNWGYAPERDRVNLIKNLPDDVVLLTTYDTFQKKKAGKAVYEVCDYTISAATAGEYFISEMTVAKEKNIKMYTMSNTAGKTWDFGVVPYLPVPYQYKKRYDQMLDFNKRYNLLGVMESHHYGLTPSFISRYEKYCFEASDLTGKRENHNDTASYLATAINDFFGRDSEKVDKALKCFSSGMEYYIPSDEVQGSPMRIGPAYPFCLHQGIKPPEDEDIYFGLIICAVPYAPKEYGRCSVHGVRQKGEIASFVKMKDLFDKGIEILESVDNPTEQTQKLLNQVKYMRCMIATTINIKNFYKYKCKLLAASTNKKVKKYADEIKKIALLEIENAKESLIYLDRDSALGYEPSMGYAGSRARVEWKIKQVNYMLSGELQKYYDSVKHRVKDLK